MAYGIGSVIGDIDQKVDTYRNNPEALAQMYQQNQQLIDLLALQKLKTEKEAAMRDMQMKMQTPAASIKDQREQEVMGMMRNEVAQQVAPGLQVAGQQAAQAAAPPVPQGGGLQSLPAPNMQGMGMAEGGIVAFADGGKTGGQDVDNPVVGYNPDGTPITRADYERMIFALEQETEPAAKEISDTEANVAEVLGENIRSTPPPSVTQPTTTTPDGIRAALPQNQTPPAGIELSEEGLNAVLNIPSNAVKQAPPEVQNEHTRHLGELREEQESKLEALIAFLQGAGGKTSFAATMSGGAAGMNAREQQIENEIMATVDKIEGLKLKEREFGISEEKNAIDREGNRLQAAASREGNRLQAAASRYNADRDFEAAMAAVKKATPQDITDQDDRVNTYVEAARVHGDTRPDAVIRQEHFETEAARDIEAAAARFGITAEQQKTELYLKVREAALKQVQDDPVLRLSLSEEEKNKKTTEIINLILKDLANWQGTAPSAASTANSDTVDPAPTQQNSGATPADPNDLLGEFYY
jgi:hypothetical protein